MGEDTYKKIFSKNLRRIMHERGKTQVDLIRDLGFNKSAVSTWVNGSRLPRMDKVQQMADYFGCLRSDLIESPSDLPAAEEDLSLSSEEKSILLSYRQADDGTRSAVRKLLDVPGESAADASAG